MTNNDCINYVQMFIDHLEQSQQNQQDVDSAYSTWCQFVRQNMYTSVPYKRVVNGYCANRHKPTKPWWNDKLSELWSRLSGAERDWLRSKGASEKTRLKTEYIKLHKSFDREVQRCKRLHWYYLQAEFEQECNIDSTRFWKSI